MSNDSVCSTCSTPLVFKSGVSKKTGKPYGMWTCPHWYTHQNKPNTNRPSKRTAVKNIDFSGVVLTAEQSAVVQGIHDIMDDDSVVGLSVSARAGTGKSTTIFYAIKELYKEYKNKNILYTAFSRKQAEEALTRMMFGTSGTIHSTLGWKAIKATYPNTVMSADKYKNKWTRLCERLVPKDNDPDEERSLQHVRRTLMKLTEKVMFSLADPYDHDVLDEIGTRYGIDYKEVREQVFGLIPSLMSLSLQTLDEEVYFADMVAAPIFVPDVTINMPFYDVLFLDEAQDTDPAQQQLVLISIGIITDILKNVQATISPKLGVSDGEVVDFTDEPMGKLIFIGDPYQSIYGFRGAIYEGMDNLVGMLQDFGDVAEYSITKTRRSARAIVEHAQKIIPDIQSMPGAPEGIVEIISMDDFIEEFAESGLSDDVMVLARVTASLVSPALKLVKRGMPVKVAGNVMASQLIWRIKKINRNIVGDSDKNADIKSIRAAILVETKRTTDKMAEATPSQRRKLQMTVDELDVLMVLTEECVYLHDIIYNINTLFHAEDGERYALFSTIHKQKGGEADTVYILDGEKMPHALAETEQELQQERHLAGVAVTRAKTRVAWVDTMAEYF